MTLQEIIRLAYSRYPEKYEIVQYGAPMDHTGECMDDYEEDVNAPFRNGFIFGYAEALGLGIDYKTMHREIRAYVNGRIRA